MARRSWDSLSESYRKRLQSAGITPAEYASGSSLKAARGHATTPERPERAFRHPDIYSEYLRRRVARGHDIPRDMLPRSVGHGPRMISDSIGWPGRETIDKWIFTRSAGGGGSHELGTMTLIRINPDGTMTQVESRTYDQADFTSLAADARKRGFIVQVISVPSMGVTA